jgi:hypothetical protein
MSGLAICCWDFSCWVWSGDSYCCGSVEWYSREVPQKLYDGTVSIWSIGQGPFDDQSDPPSVYLHSYHTALYCCFLLSPSMFSSPMLFVAQYPVRMYSGYSVAYAHCGAYVGSCDWILQRIIPIRECAIAPISTLSNTPSWASNIPSRFDLYRRPPRYFSEQLVVSGPENALTLCRSVHIGRVPTVLLAGRC